MNTQHLFEESELKDHISKFGIPLLCGNDELESTLKGPFIKNQQAKILALRENADIVEDAYKKLVACKEAEQVLRSYKQTDSSKVAEGQIFFTGDHTKSLNFIPYCIAACVFLKIWIAPALALLTPLILAIMPYIIMTTIMNVHIDWEMYKILMQQMVFGIQNGESWKLKHYGQAAWTLVSLGQSMLSPFMTAYHTYNLDKEIVKRGTCLIQLKNTAEEILEVYSKLSKNDWYMYKVPYIPNDPHEAAAWMNEESLGMKQLWKILGKLALYTQLARDPSWKPVEWLSTNKPMELYDFYDLAIPEERSVKSTISLRGHSLLTGPNRGGKSSCLRGILQQVLLGQSLGFTYKAHGSWKPYSLMFTRLKSRDTAGKESLFEMEVRFASQIIKTINCNQPSLVLIDELFHSTNPPDAEISAKLFLDLLWKKSASKSIVSTHIFSLAETDTKALVPLIQKFSCNAEELQTGKIKYSYKLTEGGICRVSSVGEVLEEAGLKRGALK
jgi:hypothetical protein